MTSDGQTPIVSSPYSDASGTGWTITVFNKEAVPVKMQSVAICQLIAPGCAPPPFSPLTLEPIPVSGPPS